MSKKQLKCLDKGSCHGPCEGWIVDRPSCTTSGIPRARCERHWSLRLER